MASRGLKRQPNPMYVRDYVRLIVSDTEMDADMTRELLWRLLDARHRMVSLMNRALIGTLAAGAAFEFLNRGLISEVSGVGMTLAKLDPLRLLLPAVLAYLFLRASVLSREAKLLDECFQELVRQRYPGFFSSNVSFLLSPSAGFAVGEFPAELASMSARTRAVHQAVVGVELVIMSFAPPVLIIYMYVQLFLHVGPANPAVWIGLVVSTLVLGATYATLFIEANSGRTGTPAQPCNPEPAPPAPRTPR
ncbi:hypothetical protein [Micromonospora sp. NPDC049274]|uniref:hypothetical protein n=1 Tax=Micromonospora sp. NPDC049274 TaxID=3154829 RepID=UPI0034429F77